MCVIELFVIITTKFNFQIIFPFVKNNTLQVGLELETTSTALTTVLPVLAIENYVHTQ